MASYDSIINNNNNNNNNNNQARSPYGSGDPYYNESTGFISPPKAAKRGLSPWIKFGVPVLVLVIIGAVVGGVLGSRSSNKSDSSSSGSSSPATKTGEAAASAAASAKAQIGLFPTATDSQFMRPIYPSTTNTAAFTEPTITPSNNAALAWPEDPFKPSNPSVTNVREDRPRLLAPAYKWEALPNLIRNDPYLSSWNDTIFGNATTYFNAPPVRYFMDGDSGILDNAREIKMRIKAFAYAYRMTKDTRWVDRTWAELQNAVSSDFGPNNSTKWNPSHFLDAAELSAAFGIAYDWLHDMWTDDQRSQIRDNLITYGLSQGAAAYDGADFGWWRTNIQGNWNCVCNGGLTLASLAILGDDTTGTATKLLGQTVNNAKQNCAFGPSEDGSWSEGANYWYFGTTGHAEMASALITATGSHYGLLDTNPNFHLTGLYHMYVTGNTLFDYGDHGPNKFSTTANSMFLYADQYKQPEYALFQRDQHDAPEPWSMFWYDPSISGAFWNGLALDHFFDSASDQWVSMRSSWTDQNLLFVGMKAGTNQGHQTHNDLDVGDFVLDAMGTRWAGDLGSADYNSPQYFNSDAQDAARWRYYRKATEGQNTLVIGGVNQLVTARPTVKHESSGTEQGSSTVFDVPSDSTAYWVTDMSSAYDQATSVKRGVRLLNARKQVLIQDEVNASAGIQWRMHTNATVATEGSTATLTINGKTTKVTILSPSSGFTLGTAPAARSSNDANASPLATDQPNPTVTVLTIDLPAGNHNLQVLFNPQWPGMSDGDFKTPPSVPLDSWSLSSHN
ncbi:hypothetical protein BDN71DRAFT_1438135 [Pleurotus eryngii]|uniref:Heparinase II/III-like C-terminal domain-containing protein n=1 Tax=Pleurotus eryngii TaxID=5323 RepID=A0A9P6ACS2_PLEER|nr:hypothetical protein BDN71DRAFT_1438135 [Pleurotus eryngii]